MGLLPILGPACSGPKVRGVYPAIDVTPKALDFGLQPVGSTTALSVKVANVGTGDLNFTVSEVRGDARRAFRAGEFPTVLHEGTSVVVVLTYTAGPLEGPDGAQWVLESDATNAPEATVSLAGRVESPCAASLTQCGGACLDLKTDDANCGACGLSCAPPLVCVGGVCGCRPTTCAAGACGDEPDGCGGTKHCGTCSPALVCLAFRCAPPTCIDGVKDQSESDIDCGGSCPRCGLDAGCSGASDCAEGLVCPAGACGRCAASTECSSDQVCDGGLCGACTSAAECGGGRACLGGRCLSCPGQAAFNECGLCGGPSVSGVGAPCVTATGCQSTYACDSAKTGTVCQPVNPNECGVCNGAPVIGLDAGCQAASGCSSATVCNAAGDAGVCAPVLRNECGLCAGPAVSGVGTSCVEGSGCSSLWACNDAGVGLACTPVGRNACNLCGGPVVSGLDAGCTAASGCASVVGCDVSGTGTACVAVARNACGLCGGPPVSGLDAGCVDASGCASRFSCDVPGTGVTCTLVGRNECGLCGGPPVSGLDAGCTAASGCASSLACNTSGTGTACLPVAKNACNLCGGPPISGLGTPCVDGVGCASTFSCDGPGTGVACTAVGRNECSLCGGPPVPGLDAGCTAASGCASVRVCNATLDGPSCPNVPKNECGLCGGAPVPGVDAGCLTATGCPGTNLCNGAGTGTTCAGPAGCFIANHLVISRLSGYGPAGAQDEFIELYNPTSAPISLTGYSLWYRPAVPAGGFLTGNNYVFTGGTVQPHRYFLAVYDAADSTYSFTSVPKDVGYIKFNMASAAGQVLLWKGSTAADLTATFPLPSSSANYADLVDFVGYGAATSFEGAGPTVSPGNGAAIVRKPNPAATTATLSPGGADDSAGNGVDRNDNALDFARVTSFTPRNSAVPAQP